MRPYPQCGGRPRVNSHAAHILRSHHTSGALTADTLTLVRLDSTCRGRFHLSLLVSSVCRRPAGVVLSEVLRRTRSGVRDFDLAGRVSTLR